MLRVALAGDEFKIDLDSDRLSAQAKLLKERGHGCAVHGLACLVIDNNLHGLDYSSLLFPAPAPGAAAARNRVTSNSTISDRTDWPDTQPDDDQGME
jgi:hypothetical protein